MPSATRCAGYRVEGGTEPAHPAGVLRSRPSPVRVEHRRSAQLIPPTLVMQGLDDTDMPGAGNAPAIYHALLEWITNGTFDLADIGTHVVDASGVARPDRT